MNGLTDRQQGLLMFAAFLLVPVSTWLALGAPFDHASIALLGSGIVGGAIAFIKETLGGTAPAAPAPVTNPVVGYLSPDGKTVVENPPTT